MSYDSLNKEFNDLVVSSGLSERRIPRDNIIKSINKSEKKSQTKKTKNKDEKGFFPKKIISREIIKDKQFKIRASELVGQSAPDNQYFKDSYEEEKRSLFFK